MVSQRVAIVKLSYRADGKDTHESDRAPVGRKGIDAVNSSAIIDGFYWLDECTE